MFRVYFKNFIKNKKKKYGLKREIYYVNYKGVSKKYKENPNLKTETRISSFFNSTYSISTNFTPFPYFVNPILNEELFEVEREIMLIEKLNSKYFNFFAKVEKKNKFKLEKKKTTIFSEKKNKLKKKKEYIINKNTNHFNKNINNLKFFKKSFCTLDIKFETNNNTNNSNENINEDLNEIKESKNNEIKESKNNEIKERLNEIINKDLNERKLKDINEIKNIYEILNQRIDEMINKTINESLFEEINQFIDVSIKRGTDTESILVKIFKDVKEVLFSKILGNLNEKMLEDLDERIVEYLNEAVNIKMFDRIIEDISKKIEEMIAGSKYTFEFLTQKLQEILKKYTINKRLNHDIIEGKKKKKKKKKKK
jgi:hypothetical protein